MGRAVTPFGAIDRLNNSEMMFLLTLDVLFEEDHITIADLMSSQLNLIKDGFYRID